MFEIKRVGLYHHCQQCTAFLVFYLARQILACFLRLYSVCDPHYKICYKSPEYFLRYIEPNLNMSQVNRKKTIYFHFLFLYFTHLFASISFGKN